MSGLGEPGGGRLTSTGGRGTLLTSVPGIITRLMTFRTGAGGEVLKKGHADNKRSALIDLPSFGCVVNLFRLYLDASKHSQVACVMIPPAGYDRETDKIGSRSVLILGFPVPRHQMISTII